MVKYVLSFIFEIIILKNKISSFLSLHDWNVKFPDNSLTFWQNFIFPWHNMKFPDNSLTLKKFKIPWHFPDAYEPWKTLIRLGGCPGWTESSLGAHIILLVLSWGGSYTSEYQPEHLIGPSVFKFYINSKMFYQFIRWNSSYFLFYPADKDLNETLLYYNWATSWENLFQTYANNKGADQPAHPRSQISTFVLRFLV